MKKECTYEERAAILERRIACYEEVLDYPDNKVRVTFTDGEQVLFNGRLEHFYEMILKHLMISVPHCREMAREVLSSGDENRIMLPIVIKPCLSFMVFERREGPLYVNWFSVRERFLAVEDFNHQIAYHDGVVVRVPYSDETIRSRMCEARMVEIEWLKRHRA
ncbi:hypothetical protein [Eubacterium limosum]|uniref:Uncharacterized protein n=1 Tax=Eubacterium limosum TaxID=1736 RepID=A0AAC9QV53_EUBLI|nr:hypothetical protein [Eubacterium limosum]ARD66166.1 hypothetical protein B2M23_11690 [Eubacterium limosum]PWW59785.1 hypothetical protein C7955_101182 [Eubacterium limosum]UQZ22067.1 hypothetical protein M5595_17815 [Eubacterium limosum]